MIRLGASVHNCLLQATRFIVCDSAERLCGKRGSLFPKSAIVAQHESASPKKRGEHHDDADIVREVGQPMIPFQQAQHRQDVVPVMSVGFFARHTADEHEIKYSGIVDVGRDVHQTLCRPPQSHRSPERVTSFYQECHETDHRHENLTKGSAENRHEATKGNEDHVSGFMKWQIDQVKKRLDSIIGFEWSRDERASPPNHRYKHHSATAERHRIRRGVRFNQPLFDRQQPRRGRKQR